MIRSVFHRCGITVRPRHVSEAAWVVIGQAGRNVGAILGLKILTTLLPRSTFGEFNLILLASAVVGWILFEPFRQATVRMYAGSRQDGELGRLVGTSVTIHAVGTLLVLLVAGAIVLSGLLQAAHIPASVLFATVAVFLAEAWQSLASGVCDAARQRARGALTATLISFGRVFFAATLIHFYGPSVAVVLVGYTIAVLIGAWPAFAPLVRDLRADDNGSARLQPSDAWFQPDIFKRMVLYGGPFAVWSLLAWAQSYLDRYVLQLAHGAGTVGPYVAACQIAAFPLGLGVMLTGQFLTPIVFERAGRSVDGERVASAERLVWKAAALYVAGGVPVVCLYALAGPQIMRVLTTPDYVVSRTVLILLAGGALAQNVGQLLATAILARNRSRALILAFAVPGVVSAPLSWFLVRLAGTAGAAAANALTSVMFVGITVVILRQLGGVRFWQPKPAAAESTWQPSGV